MNQENRNPSNFDPYSILNLNRDATQSQIKSAYRKLALKYHPDRQKTEEDKIKCKEKFLEVSRSYEVLGDPKLKEQYDKYGILHDGSSPASGYSSSSRNPRDFFGGFPGSFSDRNFGPRGGFMDPFEMFRKMFDDDFFGNDGHFSSFHDSFGVSNNNSRGTFDHPWGFGRSSFGSTFGGFGGGFNHHMNMMNDMMNMNHFSHGLSSGNGMSTSYYSSSSSSFGGNGGVQESVSTSTRVINGKRQTVTERVKILPDGTVQRSTETSGDDVFPSIMLEDDGQSKSNAVKHLLPDDNTGDHILHNNDSAGEIPPVQKKHRFFSRRDGKKDEK